MVDETLKEQVRLVEVDLAQTNELIKGVTTIGAGLRTAAITAWLGLLGFAFQQRLWSLALLASIVVAAFYIVDAYHGQIYTAALEHARRTERLISRYSGFLADRGDDPSMSDEIEGELRAFGFGCYSSLVRVRTRDLWQARPTIIFRMLYPVMIILAATFCYLIYKNYLIPPAMPTSPATPGPSVPPTSGIFPTPTPAPAPGPTPLTQPSPN